MGRPAYNPKGVNQYSQGKGQGTKSSKPMQGRMPINLDKRIRAIASHEGMTISKIMEEAFRVFLKEYEERSSYQNGGLLYARQSQD
ncbi:MAG: hypothetical protein F6K36_12555 [Symploca sp. SIO3C6]|nr:hypothetical protein [Symploca sp. SIO3C6]